MYIYPECSLFIPVFHILIIYRSFKVYLIEDAVRSSFAVRVFHETAFLLAAKSILKV